MDFKKDKYIEVLIYLIAKCGDKANVGKTVLSNLLYIIDFKYYENYGESLSGETYLKTKTGIKPLHFEELTIELIQSNVIYLRKEAYFDNFINKYYIVSIPNNNLSKKELFVIREAIREFSDYSATKLNYHLSKDAPFRNAEIDKEISYEDVFLRDDQF